MRWRFYVSRSILFFLSREASAACRVDREVISSVCNIMEGYGTCVFPCQLSGGDCRFIDVSIADAFCDFACFFPCKSYTETSPSPPPLTSVSPSLPFPPLPSPPPLPPLKTGIKILSGVKEEYTVPEGGGQRRRLQEGSESGSRSSTCDLLFTLFAEVEASGSVEMKADFSFRVCREDQNDFGYGNVEVEYYKEEGGTYVGDLKVDVSDNVIRVTRPDNGNEKAIYLEVQEGDSNSKTRSASHAKGEGVTMSTSFESGGKAVLKTTQFETQIGGGFEQAVEDYAKNGVAGDLESTVCQDLSEAETRCEMYRVEDENGVAVQTTGGEFLGTVEGKGVRLSSQSATYSEDGNMLLTKNLLTDLGNGRYKGKVKDVKAQGSEVGLGVECDLFINTVFMKERVGKEYKVRDLERMELGVFFDFNPLKEGPQNVPGSVSFSPTAREGSGCMLWANRNEGGNENETPHYPTTDDEDSLCLTEEELERISFTQFGDTFVLFRGVDARLEFPGRQAGKQYTGEETLTVYVDRVLTEEIDFGVDERGNNLGRAVSTEWEGEIVSVLVGADTMPEEGNVILFNFRGKTYSAFNNLVFAELVKMKGCVSDQQGVRIEERDYTLSAEQSLVIEEGGTVLLLALRTMVPLSMAVEGIRDENGAKSLVRTTEGKRDGSSFRRTPQEVVAKEVLGEGTVMIGQKDAARLTVKECVRKTIYAPLISGSFCNEEVVAQRRELEERGREMSEVVFPSGRVASKFEVADAVLCYASILLDEVPISAFGGGFTNRRLEEAVRVTREVVVEAGVCPSETGLNAQKVILKGTLTTEETQTLPSPPPPPPPPSPSPPPPSPSPLPPLPSPPAYLFSDLGVHCSYPPQDVLEVEIKNVGNEDSVGLGDDGVQIHAMFPVEEGSATGQVQDGGPEEFLVGERVFHRLSSSELEGVEWELVGPGQTNKTEGTMVTGEYFVYMYTSINSGYFYIQTNPPIPEGGSLELQIKITGAEGKKLIFFADIIPLETVEVKGVNNGCLFPNSVLPSPPPPLSPLPSPPPFPPPFPPPPSESPPPQGEECVHDTESGAPPEMATIYTSWCQTQSTQGCETSSCDCLKQYELPDGTYKPICKLE